MKITLKRVAGDIRKFIEADTKRIARVSTATFQEGARIIKEQGRASIAAGGFSTRWQNALRVKNYPENGVSAHPAISVRHSIKYAGQFQDPQPVIGSPLLWLPITQNLPLQARGKRWTPADFVRSVGPLRGGRRGSRPILFGLVDVGQSGGVLAMPPQGKSRHVQRTRARRGKSQKKWLPVFVGVPAVKDPKRFDVGAVVRRVERSLAEINSTEWRKTNG
jgi:hypothetical protein